MRSFESLRSKRVDLRGSLLLKLLVFATTNLAISFLTLDLSTEIVNLGSFPMLRFSINNLSISFC